MKAVMIKSYIYSLEDVRRVGHGDSYIILNYKDGSYDTIAFKDDEKDLCHQWFNTIFDIMRED